jgi:hypothetical protein
LSYDHRLVCRAARLASHFPNSASKILPGTLYDSNNEQVSPTLPVPPLFIIGTGLRGVPSQFLAPPESNSAGVEMLKAGEWSYNPLLAGRYVTYACGHGHRPDICEPEI